MRRQPEDVLGVVVCCVPNIIAGFAACAVIVGAPLAVAQARKR